jgi:hypothetical protein
MNQLKHACLLCSCLILAACANDRPVGLVEPSFGNALQQNIAGETVNPSAPADRTPLTMSARGPLAATTLSRRHGREAANIGTQNDRSWVEAAEAEGSGEGRIR